eukprot:s255_g4.t1
MLKAKHLQASSTINQPNGSSFNSMSTSPTHAVSDNTTIQLSKNLMHVMHMMHLMRIRNHWAFTCSFKDCKDVSFPVLQALRFIGLPQKHMTFSLQTERLGEEMDDF